MFVALHWGAFPPKGHESAAWFLGCGLLYSKTGVLFGWIQVHFPNPTDFASHSSHGRLNSPLAVAFIGASATETKEGSEEQSSD
jgi:hypothetical protein